MTRRATFDYSALYTPEALAASVEAVKARRNIATTPTTENDWEAEAKRLADDLEDEALRNADLRRKLAAALAERDALRAEVQELRSKTHVGERLARVFGR